MPINKKTKLRLVEQCRERGSDGKWTYFFLTPDGQRLEGCAEPGDAYWAPPWMHYGERQHKPGATLHFLAVAVTVTA